MASVKKTILSRGAIFVCLMTEPILLLGITEIGQSEALKPCLTNSQHIHKLTITHHRHHFDGTLDINQVEYRICGICLLSKIYSFIRSERIYFRQIEYLI